jgi:prepilin-type N-terminal cleavage/methylation domain-containing protein
VTSRRGGFTLIELLIGTAVMLIILTGAVAVLLAASAQHRRALERTNLERSCTLLIGQMEAELRQAGLGVPKGTDQAVGGVRFPASIVEANAGDIAFLADLPRPESSFNGFSQLSDLQQPSIPLNGVAVVNELTGPCDVDSAGHCRTDDESPLFAPSGTDCATSALAQTCPWALNKYQPSEWILIANGAGDWVERQLQSPVHAATGTRRHLSFFVNLPGLFPGNVPNRGFVSTPDLVVYRLAGNTVTRQQCWGQIGVALDPASLLARRCLDTDAPPTGTVAEVRARDVFALTFEYRDAADAVLATPVPLADLRRIRRVVINLALQRVVGASTLSTGATASATVRL